MAVPTFVAETDHDAIHAAFVTVRDYVESLDPSRERSLALTKLDEAKMWTFAHHRVRAGGDP